MCRIQSHHKPGSAGLVSLMTNSLEQHSKKGTFYGAPAKTKKPNLAGIQVFPFDQQSAHLTTELTDSHGKCPRILRPKKRLSGPDQNPSWLIFWARAEEHIVCHLLLNQPSGQPYQGLSEILVLFTTQGLPRNIHFKNISIILAQMPGNCSKHFWTGGIHQKAPALRISRMR